MAAAYTPRSLTVYAVPVVLGAALGSAAVVRQVPQAERAIWQWGCVVAVVVALCGVLTSLVRRAGKGQTGAADLVTLTRAGAVAVVSTWAVLGSTGLLAPTSWWLTAVATAALVLDGVDGAVARRRGESTTAGARLDAETDAVMTLALAVLVAGQVGGWVLLAGGLRYLFAGVALARWGGAAASDRLPPRPSRRLVAATSSALLAAATAPVLTGVSATLLAGCALALLLASFAADASWLERDRRGGVVGDVVGGPALQRGVDAPHVLPEDAETEQLERSDGRHDDHR